MSRETKSLNQAEAQQPIHPQTVMKTLLNVINVEAASGNAEYAANLTYAYERLRRLELEHPTPQPSPEKCKEAQPPAMRAKLFITQVESQEATNYCDAAETLHFSGVAASGYPDDGSDENNTYAKFSPLAELKLRVANPNLVGKCKKGDIFYLDFHAAPGQSYLNRT